MRKFGLSVLLWAFVSSCAPAISPVNPPENYKGPAAEGPKLQARDYWIYERGDGRRVKVGAGSFLSNLRFPLWVGKTWKYPSEGIPMDFDPATYRAGHVPLEISCEVTGFKGTRVTAGKFEAFECECLCTVIAAGADYDPFCGQWTVWYAPKVKNIIRIKTESTATNAELVEYDVSGKDTGR